MGQMMTSKRPNIKSRNRVKVVRAWLFSILKSMELRLHLDYQTSLSCNFKSNYLAIAEDELEFTLVSGEQRYIEEFIYAFISDKSWKKLQSKSARRVLEIAEHSHQKMESNIELNNKVSIMVANALKGGYEPK